MADNGILNNFVYLSENISNLPVVLNHLLQDGTISINEKEQIESERTSMERNGKLLTIIQTKGWLRLRDQFLEILRKTNNAHCAEEIETVKDPESGNKGNEHSDKRKCEKIGKWWPDKKRLIKSLHKRKCGDKFLVEELHDRVFKDENRMVVLCESSDAAKFSGMGGVGKTLTAKWYAHHYEKEYDHILWIDCGEDSLLKSFKELASDLDVSIKKEFEDDVEKLARKCFQVLSNFTCLWIYDNAESYQGEQGIINVLPKFQNEFYSLITSRSREWGTETGYGKISDLQLEIFSQTESIEFLERNLKNKIKFTEYEIKELCGLLGNLPLAIQLAVAALNSGKIDLQNYLQKTTAEDTAKIVDSKFDDYEKTINKNIKISLDLILQEKRKGKLAFDILMAFGYIRPDDVQSKLFMKIFKSNVDVVKEAVDILEKYSLVSRTGSISEFPYDDGVANKIFGRDKMKVEMDLLSIHRLLQQVIRHNGKEKERKTLKKILGCEGFIDYKFIPFTKYAGEDLKKQFPKVKAELLDQQQLRKLLKDRRLEDAVEVAKFIDEEINTQTTKLNYAICLQKCGQLEECLEIVEQMFVKRNITVNPDLATCLEKLFKCAHKMAGRSHDEYDYPRLLDLAKEATEVDVGIVLLYSHLRLGNHQAALPIAKQIVTDPGQLLGILTVTQIPNYHLRVDTNLDTDTVDLKLDVETKEIYWRGCSLSLNYFDRISPEELTLSNVSFLRDGQEVELVKVNEFLDLKNIKRLNLICDEKKNNLSLDLSGDISMEYIRLDHVKVFNWTKCNWNVKELKLNFIPFVEKTNIHVQKLSSWDSSLDVSCLPQTIQQINLDDPKVFVSGGVELTNLNYLTLEWMEDVGCLSHFRSAPISHIHLNCIYEEVNVDLLPLTISGLKINKYNNCRVVGGVRKVDKLILEHFPFEELEDCLSHLETGNLVIYNMGPLRIESVLLLNKEIKTIAVGGIYWEKGEFKNHSSQLDRQADCYFLQGGRGRAMGFKEFQELIELF